MGGDLFNRREDGLYGADAAPGDAKAIDSRRGPWLTTTHRDRVKHVERENRELKRANEILRKAVDLRR